MNCLSAGRLAAVERTEEEIAHLASCGRCRIEARRRARFLAAYTAPPAPPAFPEPPVEPVGRYEDLGIVSHGGQGEVRQVRDLGPGPGPRHEGGSPGSGGVERRDAHPGGRSSRPSTSRRSR